jgi:hypothetical protein
VVEMSNKILCATFCVRHIHLPMAAAGRGPHITWDVKMEAYLFDAFDTIKAARAQQRSGPSALRQKDLSTSAVFAFKARCLTTVVN